MESEPLVIIQETGTVVIWDSQTCYCYRVFVRSCTEVEIVPPTGVEYQFEQPSTMKVTWELPDGAEVCKSTVDDLFCNPFFSIIYEY